MRQQHALGTFYVGQAKSHYRNMKYYVPETQGYRIACTAKLFPTYCKMPAIEPADTIKLASQDLIQALRNRNKHTPINLAPKYTEALWEHTRILAVSTSNYYNVNSCSTRAKYNHPNQVITPIQQSIEPPHVFIKKLPPKMPLYLRILSKL